MKVSVMCGGGGSLFAPSLAVEAPVAYGFADVGGRYALGAGQVGNGSRHAQNTFVGTCRKVSVCMA